MSKLTFLNTRPLTIDDEEYVIPDDLSIMYVNGIPFCHFRGNVVFDSEVADDYAICIEGVPNGPCRDYLKAYIRKNFMTSKDFVRLQIGLPL
jgi:hypothetical protein